MSRVWVDLTEMAEWTGQLTGIPRVVVSIAGRWLHHPRAVFCIAHPERGFEEISVEQAEGILGAERRVRTQPGQVGPAAGPSRARRLARTVLLRSPRWLRSGLLAGRDRLRPPVHAREFPHPFQDGDVLLVLGPSWARPEFTRALWQIRGSTRLGVIHVVYDMIPVLFPQFFGAGFPPAYLREMVNVAAVSDRLLAISESTAEDVRRFQREVGVEPAVVSTFTLGSDLPADPEPGAAGRRIADREFVLCVGTVEARKNHRLLYDSWCLAADEGWNFPLLVIVGRPGFLTGDLLYELETDPRAAGNILWLSEVGDAELAWLYQNCVMTVYPSWYEGWGLPITESLAAAKLPLVSSSSSMPEAGGDFAQYFAPHSVDQFSALLRRWLDDRVALAAAESRIAHDYRRSTWDGAFEQVEAAVDELAAQLVR